MTDHLLAMRDLNPLQRAFNMFIMNLPSGDLDNLVNFIRHSDEAERLICQNEFMRQTSEVLAVLSNKERVPGSPTSSDGSVRTTRGKKMTDRKLRPLNSFIAFRSFYSTMFPEMTQKSKSGVIRYLWQADPHKGKWAILAKAYSLLRDDHGSNVSLDTFLELTVPFIGLIRPEDYLNIMGCQIVLTDEQQYRIESISSSGQDLTDSATTYSVADIVNYCYERGYVESVKTSVESEATSQLLFATQPNITIRTDQGAINLDNVNRIMEYNNHTTDNNTEVETFRVSSLLDVHEPIQTQDNLYGNIENVLNELREHNGGDPDLYAPFNPAVQTFPLYDPMAHDPFDAYNISDLRF